MIAAAVHTHTTAAALPAATAGLPLLAMAVLYPASALLVQRRFGSGWLPTTAAAALLPFAAAVAGAVPALPSGARLAAAVTTLALLQVALPVGLATTAIWRLEGRGAAPALQLAGGVAAYLAALPLAAAVTAAALVAVAR